MQCVQAPTRSWQNRISFYIIITTNVLQYKVWNCSLMTPFHPQNHLHPSASPNLYHLIAVSTSGEKRVRPHEDRLRQWENIVITKYGAFRPHPLLIILPLKIYFLDRTLAVQLNSRHVSFGKHTLIHSIQVSICHLWSSGWRGLQLIRKWLKN